MIIRNATQKDIADALYGINGKYEGNIVFKRFDTNGRGFNVTLTVKQSKGKGGRIGVSGRRVCAACWHVHGDFFDSLFTVNPTAYVWSGGHKITKDYGNWQDMNIGSLVNPLMYSDACDCNNLVASSERKA